jgi:hypothetical protein
MEMRFEQWRAITHEGRTMVLEQTDDGVVTVRYQEEDFLDDEEAVVRVTPDRDGRGMRLHMHREGRGDTILRLTEDEALAIVAALTGQRCRPH